MVVGEGAASEFIDVFLEMKVIRGIVHECPGSHLETLICTCPFVALLKESVRTSSSSQSTSNTSCMSPFSAKSSCKRLTDLQSSKEYTEPEYCIGSCSSTRLCSAASLL